MLSEAASIETGKFHSDVAGFEVLLSADPAELNNAVTAPALQRILNYWDEARGRAEMPSRDEIDLLQIQDGPANLFMLEVEQGGAQYRVRLMGMELVAFYDRDPTGELVEDFVDEENAKTMYRFFNAIVHDRVCAASRGKVYWVTRRDHLGFQSIHLPLSDPRREKVAIILGQTIFERPMAR